jgi:UDP-sugar transporter A1/2/3
MAFYILRLADPGSLALAKSTAPYLVALMLRCSGQRINELQYVPIIPNPNPNPNPSPSTYYSLRTTHYALRTTHYALRTTHYALRRYVAIITTCLAIGVVQYDVCKGGGVLPARVYAVIAGSNQLLDPYHEPPPPNYLRLIIHYELQWVRATYYPLLGTR